MTVESEQDLTRLKQIGRVVALALQQMSRQVRPGITTAELDAIGDAFLKKHGAHSAPNLTYGFPGVTCISLNDEAAHGIPGSRVIRPGDLVNIDVSAELNDYFADTAVTVPVPPVAPLAQRLCRCARSALMKALAVAQAGRPINGIGRAPEKEARRCGFSIIRNLPGHGVGRALHEAPEVPGFFLPSYQRRLTEGLVITVEPFLSTHADHVVEAGNGWTLKTPDGSLSAQYEHTIVVRRGRPLVITAV